MHEADGADSKRITFRFRDRGVAFDPLTRPDPDITLPAEQRTIGGLGIFMTRKLMDSVVYARETDENVLTITKTVHASA